MDKINKKNTTKNLDDNVSTHLNFFRLRPFLRIQVKHQLQQRKKSKGLFTRGSDFALD